MKPLLKSSFPVIRLYRGKFDDNLYLLAGGDDNN